MDDAVVVLSCLYFFLVVRFFVGSIEMLDGIFCVIVLFVICEWIVGWLCECMLGVFSESFLFLFFKNSSTLLNNFFFLCSIVIDDTDDKGLFVLMCVGNALFNVGKGGKSLSYISLICIRLLSSQLDIFMFVSPILSSSSSESNSYLSGSSGSSLSVS